MPVSGEEGFEALCICPYDKSHEIRRGRMQVHLDKCRKNEQLKKNDLVTCAFNSAHIVPQMELQFHTEEDCGAKAGWDMQYVEIGGVDCPVQDLVDVQQTIPDTEEAWDDMDSKDSVLNLIKEGASNKPILRNMQCESKAKRREFRENERMRFTFSNIDNFVSPDIAIRQREPVAPLRRPTKAPENIQVKVQKYEDAQAILMEQFHSSCRTDDNSETSSMYNTGASALDSSLTVPSGQPSCSQSSVSYSSLATNNMPSRSMDSSALAEKEKSVKNNNARSNRRLQQHEFCEVLIPGLGRGSLPRK